MSRVLNKLRIVAPDLLISSPYSSVRSLEVVSFHSGSIDSTIQLLTEGEADLALVSLTDFLQYGNLLSIPYGVFSKQKLPRSATATEIKSWANYAGLINVGQWTDPVFSRLAYIWAYANGTIDHELIATITSSFQSAVLSAIPFAREWADRSNFNRISAQTFVEENIVFTLDEIFDAELKAEINQAIASKKLPSVRSDSLHPLSPKKKTTHEEVEEALTHLSCGLRLSVHSAAILGEHARLADLALAADQQCREQHPTQTRGYEVVGKLEIILSAENTPNWQISKSRKNKSVSILTREEMRSRVESLVASNCKSIVIEGEILPETGIEYYAELIHWITTTYRLDVYALSPDELIAAAEVSSLSIEDSLATLKNAGLKSLPGSKNELRKYRSGQRVSSEQVAKRLHVHRIAHIMGIPSSCSLLFSEGDSWQERMLHLQKLRSLQDETNGFSSFSAIPQFQFDQKNSSLSDLALDFLRLIAVARIFLDNFSNIYSNWYSLSPSLGQTALLFGANSFGPVLFPHIDGLKEIDSFRITSENVKRHILEAGINTDTAH